MGSTPGKTRLRFVKKPFSRPEKTGAEMAELKSVDIVVSGAEAFFLYFRKREREREVVTISLIVHHTILIDYRHSNNRAIEFSTFDIVFQTGEYLLNYSHAVVFVAVNG